MLPIAYPNTTSFAATQDAFWSLQESGLIPSCIVAPQTSQDVSDILSILTGTTSPPSYGESHACQFAIKSQGHAPAAGFANIGAPGLTIDLTSLRSVDLNDDQSVASVGSGASWLDVYAALDPYDKSVAGGRNGAVGVGGLTLGGGISYFSPQVGFTCDTVVNFEIALSSGDLINANATANSDLFRALKGGGNNFGVITRFDFKTVDIGLIAAGSIIHPSTSASRKAVFKAFANIASAPQYDVHASLVTGLIFNSTSKEWVLSSTPIYTLPDLRPPVYDELYAAPNLTSTTKLTKLSVLSNETATPPLNWLFRTATFDVSAEFLETIYDALNATVWDFQLAGQGLLLWDVALEPLPTVFVSHGANNNSLGTTPKDGNSMIVLLSALWAPTSANESSIVQQKADEAMNRIHKAAESAKLAKRFVYANYAGAQQKPYISYGQEDLVSLRQTAKRYDPQAMFQTAVPGGFKLWR